MMVSYVFNNLLSSNSISHQWFSHVSGYGRATVSDWRTGKYVPKPFSIAVIADTFGKICGWRKNTIIELEVLLLDLRDYDVRFRKNILASLDGQEQNNWSSFVHDATKNAMHMVRNKHKDINKPRRVPKISKVTCRKERPSVASP